MRCSVLAIRAAACFRSHGPPVAWGWASCPPSLSNESMISPRTTLISSKASGGMATSATSSSSSSGVEGPHHGIMNVWAVGRNYLEHIKELGNHQDLPSPPSTPPSSLGPAAAAPTTTTTMRSEEVPPMIFLKSGSSIVSSGKPIILPRWSSDVHHEIELAIMLGRGEAKDGKGGLLIPVAAAVSLDLTLRDVQTKLKKAQHPWTLAKSFKCSTPLGPFFPLAEGLPKGGRGGLAKGGGGGINLQNLQLHLEVNGKTRQHGTTADMLYKIDDLISYVQCRFPVVPGDIILTGTPHGVSRLQAGDQILAQVLSSSGEVVLSEGRWTARDE